MANASRPDTVLTRCFCRAVKSRVMMTKIDIAATPTAAQGSGAPASAYASPYQSVMMYGPTSASAAAAGTVTISVRRQLCAVSRCICASGSAASFG